MHNVTNRLHDVISRADCANHGADTDEFCWNIFGIGDKLLGAVCNDRIGRAGFVGEIDPTSIKMSKKRL